MPCHSVDPPSCTSQAPSPFIVAPSPSPPRSPFASLPPTTAPASGISDLPPPVVAGPFAQHPAPPSVATFNSSFSPQSEFCPPRLTRFLEMSLDRYVNVVTAMINDGRFSHIGHGVLRLEGQTAWGVWLRINHWDSSQGRRARLRGVLYWFCLHCEAIVAPSFPGLDFCHLGFSPISFSSGEPQPPLAPAPRAPSAPPPPQPHPSSPCTSHRCQGCQELISLVRRLTFQLEALQIEVYRMARAAASPPLSPQRPFLPHPVLPHR